MNYQVAAILFDNKCRFTTKDFEQAQKTISGKLKTRFKEIKYHSNKRILLIHGIVMEPNFGKIQVEWNYEGRAFIANEPFPEFDLPVEDSANFVSR